MAIIKVIELLSESGKSWEDAAQKAVAEASKTIRNIRSVYIEDFNAEVKNNKIAKYRVSCKITFEKE